MPIQRRSFLKTAILVAGGIFSLFATETSPLWAAGDKPNIVVILADDLGFADLGFQGSREIRTPHIDTIAHEGVQFKNGYVSHPFCSPTRAGLLTGRYQQRFGHENNMLFEYGNPNDGLPVSETTLPELLGRAGYATGLIGKWHLGAHEKFHPLRRGFKEMYGFQGGGHDYFDPGAKGDTRQHLLPIEREDGTNDSQPGYLTTALGREAAAFVRRHKQAPFFLYLAFNAPHSPLQAPEEWIQKYSSIADPQRRTYAAMVAAMDDAVGSVLTALREEQVEQDTLVFFLSDNGGPTDNRSSNHPLRATKRTVYEGGIHVPFVMRWPAKLQAGSTFDAPVISMDVFSTALAAAGVEAPQDRKIDGTNLLPYLEGKVKGRPHEHLFWRMFGGVHLAARDSRYKLVRSEGKPDELFDLDQDISENNNVVASQPLAHKSLAAALESWNRELVKPLWLDHIQDRDQLIKK